MLNILVFLLDLVDQHVIWVYVACLLLILYHLRAYILAHENRANTIFTIEREVASHKEGRAMSNIGAILGVVVAVTALKYYVVPTVDVEMLVDPTPTVALLLPSESEPTYTPAPIVEEPTPTPRRRPTRVAVATLELPTPTQPPPASCPDANVRILSPRMGTVISGVVSIEGTANHARLQFYKVEIAHGQDPVAWSVLNDVHKNPVIGGLLEVLDTRTVPNGAYWLQLTVVDETGNFPPPCAVSVVIQN